MSDERTVRCIVRGRVQGVGFRYSTRREATHLGLRGWARNNSDGSVEVVLCGSAPSVDSMLEWLRHGPRYAHVEALTVTDLPPEPGLHAFEIRH